MSLTIQVNSGSIPSDEAKERGRSPAQIPFLFVSKLHSMLQDCDQDPDGKGSIVSWISDGKAFRVHKRKLFVETILPSYFNQTKYKSFQRQLNLWGFDRIVKSGSEKGAYYHVHFLRDQPLVIHKMRRIRAIKKVPAKERRRRLALFQQEQSQHQMRQDNVSVSTSSATSDGSISSSTSRGDDNEIIHDHAINQRAPSVEENWSAMILDGENHSLPNHQRQQQPIYAPSPSTSTLETCTIFDVATASSSSSSSSSTSRGPTDSPSHQVSEDDKEPDYHDGYGGDGICGKELDAILMKSEFCRPSNNGMFMDEQDDISLISASSSLSLLDEFIPFFSTSPEDHD